MSILPTARDRAVAQTYREAAAYYEPRIKALTAEVERLTLLLAHSPEWHVINTANDGQDLPPYGDVVEAYTVEGDLILAFRDENDDGEHWFDEVVNRTIVGLSDSWDVDSNYITHWRKHTPPTKDGDT